MKELMEVVIGKDTSTITEKSFMVPTGCKRLSIEHDLPEEYGFLVFFIIRDPDGKIRFQKQLSCSESRISVGSDASNTTIGGVPGVIKSGVWKIDIILFSEYLKALAGDNRVTLHISISDHELPVTEVIGGSVWTKGEMKYEGYDFQKLFQKEKRWYKGDLHTHTRLSDGVELPETASRKAEFMELDYYVPTEHNVLHTGWPQTDVMILPGVEITTTLGHANLFGIDQRPESLDGILVHKEETLLKQDIKAIIKECRERNWLFSVNHPFLYVWKWLMEELPLEAMDCLEIINDPTYEAEKQACAKEANEKAVLLADALWEDGYRVCAIGGSDSHKKIDDFYEGACEPSIPGDPATWLYMDGLSPEHLMKALRDCHSYVTRYCKVEAQLMACDGEKTEEVCFGDRLGNSSKRLTYVISLEALNEEPVIFYILNGKKYVCQQVECDGRRYKVTGSISLKDGYNWIRFGAQKQDGSFLFYANPVTRGEKEHRFHRFGKIRKYVEEQWRSKEFYLTKTER